MIDTVVPETSHAQTDAQIVLEAKDVSKQYPGTLALDRVNIQLRSGRVSALIGENGAGKSTLVKILAGIEAPSAGALFMDGKEIRMRSVNDADAYGIGIIHQELNLCPNLSIAENIFLGNELRTRTGLVDHSRQLARARELLQRMEQPIHPGALVEALPLGQQQIVEIAKALSRDVRVLMMDEPTSALSATEIEVLFRIIGDLTARGVSIVYISHRLEELLHVAHDVWVLRDGRMVANGRTSEVNTKWIVEHMTGRPALNGGRVLDKTGGRELLKIDSVALTSNTGRPVVRGVSLSVRSGEIVGVYGLMGAGRTELLECLMGLHANYTGRIWLDSKPVGDLDTAERIAAGMAMVPEDRQVSGLIQSLCVRENMTLASLARFTRGPCLFPRNESKHAGAMVSDLRIKAPGLEYNISSLSGGNQQKVIIARCLLTSPKILLLDEPTRGVDVGAKDEIYAIVRRLAESGMGIIFVSSELEEIRSVATRILVMSRGMITGEFAIEDSSGDALAFAASAALAQKLPETYDYGTN